jgi:hypothetical protein
MASSSMASSSHLRAVLLAAALPIAFAACGSKTGLLIDDTSGTATADGGLQFPPSDASTLPDIPCVDGTFTLTAAQAEVIFLIDRSGSMSFGIDGNIASMVNPSRWDQLASALTPVLTSIEGTVQMGAKFFPEPIDMPSGDPQTACAVASSVDVQPGLFNAKAISSIFQSTQPRGGTPTAAAVGVGASILTSTDTRAVTRFMVLATDGAPNCAPEGKNPKTCVCTAAMPTDCSQSQDGAYSCLDGTSTVQALKDAFDKQKVPTFVIGIGEQERPEFAAVLDDMAIAGGRPRDAAPHYYKVLVQQDLTDAFSKIQSSITQCTFVTPSKPQNPDAISIVVNGVTVANDPSHTNGWDYVNKDFGEIQLFGNACELAKAGMTKVTATVDCKLSP